MSTNPTPARPAALARPFATARLLGLSIAALGAVLLLFACALGLLLAGPQPFFSWTGGLLFGGYLSCTLATILFLLADRPTWSPATRLAYIVAGWTAITPIASWIIYQYARG